ncbi:MAG: transporter substrate-binding domain-containing protein, partial [Evtepia sp.]
MKKLTALLLSVLMLTSLCACGAKPADPTTDAPDAEKPLRVAMECSYAPYNWTQPDDSNGAVPINGTKDFAYGYDVMMAKRIADGLGRELQIVKKDWDSLPIALQSDEADLVIAGQSITTKRLKQVDFTTPYYYASIVTLVKGDGKFANAKGIAELSGATCTSQLGTVWYDICLPQLKDANILPAQETAPSMLVALDSGAVDLVVTDMPTAKAALIVYPDMKILDFTEQDDNYKVSEE